MKHTVWRLAILAALLLAAIAHPAAKAAPAAESGPMYLVILAHWLMCMKVIPCRWAI